MPDMEELGNSTEGSEILAYISVFSSIHRSSDVSARKHISNLCGPSEMGVL